MKKTFLLPLCVTPVLLLSGCASKPDKPPKEQPLFVTNIKPDGSKMFSFSVAMRAEKQGRDGGGRGRESGGGGRGGRGGKGAPPERDGQDSQGRSDEDRIEKIYEALDLKLGETGYCREGYIEIDTYETETRFNILGECNDSATNEDKALFINDYGY
ncbi:hypothetical protein [Alteromonas sp. C1M14]|uniref:hypothetical protein n=1 Tax=Alteromonas sp. C1M14 TaxID=2841567 RepID=UPI001C090C9E|nr:hypothetical protein [Alteromonas sp. C1M14]MBU2979293.1 hypothetical protein [Alteromonas sp. C1M14]